MGLFSSIGSALGAIVGSIISPGAGTKVGASIGGGLGGIGDAIIGGKKEEKEEEGLRYGGPGWSVAQTPYGDPLRVATPEQANWVNQISQLYNQSRVNPIPKESIPAQIPIQVETAETARLIKLYYDNILTTEPVKEVKVEPSQKEDLANVLDRYLRYGLTLEEEKAKAQPGIDPNILLLLGGLVIGMIALRR